MPRLPDSRCEAAGPRWPRAAEAHGERSSGHADHLHHGSSGRPNDGAGHEGWSVRVPDQADRGDVLLHTIRHAIERSHAALRHQAQIRALQSRYELLSHREREVMRLVVCGRLNKQVGSELGISEITVKAHRGKVMRKMPAGSFAELVNMAASLRRGTPAKAAHPDALEDFATSSNRFSRSHRNAAVAVNCAIVLAMPWSNRCVSTWRTARCLRDSRF